MTKEQESEAESHISMRRWVAEVSYEKHRKHGANETNVGHHQHLDDGHYTGVGSTS